MADTPQDDELRSAPPELNDPTAAAASSGHWWSEWRDVLRNRFIMGGAGILVVLLLVAIVLVSIGGGNDGDNGSSASNSETPEADTTVISLRGVPGQMLRTTTMRNGPSEDFGILGLIANGTAVSVVGRSADEVWLQVLPSNSGVRGWVPAETVRVEGNISEISITGPGEEPDIPVPTGVFIEEPDFIPTEPIFIPPTIPPEEPTSPPEPTPTRTGRPNATSTPVPTPLPPTPTAAPPTATPQAQGGDEKP